MKPGKTGNDFLKRLPCIETVIFSDGGYFMGHTKTTVHFSGSQAVFDTEALIPPADGRPVHSEEMTKARFLARLRSLHIEEWDREYVASNVLDGEQWELEIRFADGCKPLIISGDNAYPPHFKSLQRLMTIPAKRKS